MKLIYKQVFYSLNSALEVELSHNGVFFTVAPVNSLKNNNGNLTYNWKDKKVSKFSSSELAYLLEGLKAFRKSPAQYTAEASKLFGNNYRNFQFTHKFPSRPDLIRLIGWNVFTGKDGKERFQFTIKSTKKGKEADQVFFNVQLMDFARLEAFLNFILNMSFSFDASNDLEKRIEASESDEIQIDS